MRDPVVVYVDGSGVCPKCKSSVGTRLRCPAHLTDSRRARCRQAILTGEFTRLAASELKILEAADRVSRGAAQTIGKSHPQALGSAMTADGKRVGHVKA